MPTEAEWERAARGTEGRKYPWGKEEPGENRTNFNNNIGHPTPVGIFPQDATPEAVVDMGGNVWEWCADWCGEYGAESVSNPRGSERASDRVTRGGGWTLAARGCRAAYRDGFPPQPRWRYLGFRMAAVPRTSGGSRGGRSRVLSRPASAGKIQTRAVPCS